jgi:repressor LexA
MYGKSTERGKGMALTEKQAKVLEFIQEYSRIKGEAPSQREIAAHFGFRSLGTVQDYLSALQARGALEKSFYSKRNLQIVQMERQLPLLGKVAAGRPVEYVFHDKTIEVPSTMLRGTAEHFALLVSGDSMLDVGILDGDYVVVRKQEAAQPGEIVVAMINNEALIKRYFFKRGRVELHSENPKYAPILPRPEDDFRLLGIFAGLLRVN